jgi:YD repeat-containing protein
MRFKQTDANGNTMTYGYDDQNRRISTTNAAGETSATMFDDASNGIGVGQGSVILSSRASLFAGFIHRLFP